MTFGIYSEIGITRSEVAKQSSLVCDPVRLLRFPRNDTFRTSLLRAETEYSVPAFHLS